MQQLIAYTLYSLALLIPLIFTPGTSELFEFPKFLILISATLIIVAAWTYQTFRTKRFQFAKPNAIGYSLLALLATQTISTLFSIHPYTSFWGYYGRFHGGLFSTLCYTIIYFAATNWMDTKSTQKLIKVMLNTSIFVAVLAILEHYNLSLSCIIINYTQNIFADSGNLSIDFPWSNFFTNACWSAATNPGSRSFSLLGQPNWLAAYLIPHLFLSLYNARINSKLKSTLPILQFAILLAALLLTRSRSGFLAFALSYIAYWLILARQSTFTKLKQVALRYTLLLIPIFFLFSTPYTPSITDLLSRKPTTATTNNSVGTVLENGGTESGDIRKIVWSGAIKSILAHPFLGSGPETFAYTYYQFRPAAHNMTSEWDFLYNKAHNEYLNTAAGAGFIGLLAYLYFHYAVFAASFTKIVKSKKINQDDDERLRQLYPIVGATVVSFTVTSFFGFSVIPVYLTLILITIMVTTLGKESEASKDSLPLALYFIFPLLLIYPMRMYLADKEYTLGKQYLDGNKVELAIPLLKKAISYRPGLDLFHASMAEAYAQIDQKDRSLSEIQLNQKLNPVHLNFFRSRAKSYLIMATKEPAYYIPAAQEIERARALAPTDPKLAYNLGLIYTRTNQLVQAEQQLKDAIFLKPNYAEPYYALTLLYEQTKKATLIPALLTQAKSNLATYSAQLKEKIDKYAN